MNANQVEAMAKAHQVVIVEHSPHLLLFEDAPPTPPPRTPLTERETACLQYLADGKRPAEQLEVTETTAKRMLANAYRKLRVHDQAGAIFAAMRLGIIS